MTGPAARSDLRATPALLAATIIRPSPTWAPLQLHEVWQYRELLLFLVWRDIKVRYKQTALGAAWAIIQPLVAMIVFTVFFGRLARVPSDGLPYPLFAYAALLPWQLFANALTQSSNSVVAGERLITKVYFPRLIIPLASVLSAVVDFAIAFLIVLGMIAWYRVTPTWAVLALPLFFFLTLATSLAAGLWLAALNVEYRDVRYTLNFLVQLWLFVSPVAYSSSLIPERWRPLYGLNPMAGAIEGFRWALLRHTASPGAMLAVSTSIMALILIGGLYYYRRMEKTFADVV